MTPVVIGSWFVRAIAAGRALDGSLIVRESLEDLAPRLRGRPVGFFLGAAGVPVHREGAEIARREGPAPQDVIGRVARTLLSAAGVYADVLLHDVPRGRELHGVLRRAWAVTGAPPSWIGVSVFGRAREVRGVTRFGVIYELDVVAEPLAGGAFLRPLVEAAAVHPMPAYDRSTP